MTVNGKYVYVGVCKDGGLRARVRSKIDGNFKERWIYSGNREELEQKIKFVIENDCLPPSNKPKPLTLVRNKIIKAKVIKTKRYKTHRTYLLRYSKKYSEEHKQWYREFKSHCKCEICGESASECLDFHHRNPSEKDNSISRLAVFKKHDKFYAEIKKCICLCANCHRKIHAGTIVLGDEALSWSWRRNQTG